MTANDIFEIWRPIPNWDGYYEACIDGRIRSVKRLLTRPHPKNTNLMQTRVYGGKVLSPKIGTSGYPAVSLWRENKGVTIEVHRLVCSAFNGLPSDGMDVNHMNGCRTDNKANNLEWVTRKDNLLHAERVLGTKMVWVYQRERAIARRNAI